jgi:transglutaminase-like putative cysteine protease/Ca2+/Na+ antiporter
VRFHVVHKLMSYLLAVAAVGTLLCTGSVPPSTTALLLVSGVASWFVEPGTGLGRVLGRAGLVFNIGALAFFGLSLFEVVRSFPEPDLTPILNLVLFLLVYKLFHRRSNRDYLQLYILSFLVVLAGAWLAQTVLFVVGFATYVVLATWTLILFHLRHEIEDNYLVKHLPESATEKVTAARVLNSRRVVGRAFFVATGLVSLTVLAGAALVFALVPRIGIGFLSGTVRRRMSFVGFSDEVRLGQHGVLSQDNDTVVLRVNVPRIEGITDEEKRDRSIGRLYWRGTVYDRYIPPTASHDGESGLGQWVRSRADATRNLHRRQPSADGGVKHLVISPEAPEQKKSVSKLIEESDVQFIQIVGLSFPVAFALDHPVAYEMKPPPTGSFVTTDFMDRWSGEVALRPVRLTQSGQYLALNDFSGGQYIAYSKIGAASAEGGLPISALPPEQLATYLEVPPSISPRVRALALQVTQGRALPLAKVAAVTEWLRSTHQYTTDLKRNPDIVDPLEDFLFHESAGHCEYFATATAMLLRIAGIPTRYVNGFLGGEWNDMSKHITIRDNRAHSWTEAYLGPMGWVRVDSTPVATRASRMSRVRQIFDSVELFWSRWIIQYDASRQLDLAKRLGRQLGMEKGRARPSAHWRPNYRLMLSITGAVVILGLGWRLRRRWRRQGPAMVRRSSRGGPPVFRLYHKTLDRLAARGWPRQPAETPDEFAGRLAEAQVTGAEAFRKLTGHYTAARYGERPVPDGALSALAPDLDSVGRARRGDDRPAA